MTLVADIENGSITEECVEDVIPFLRVDTYTGNGEEGMHRPFRAATFALPMVTTERPGTGETAARATGTRNHGVWWQKVNIHQSQSNSFSKAPLENLLIK